METRNDLLNDTASTTIREDLRMKDTIYLPINMDLAYEIYWNLINYIQNTYDHLVTTATDFNNDDELCPLVDDDDHISGNSDSDSSDKDKNSRQLLLWNLWNFHSIIFFLVLVCLFLTTTAKIGSVFSVFETPDFSLN